MSTKHFNQEKVRFSIYQHYKNSFFSLFPLQTDIPSKIVYRLSFPQFLKQNPNIPDLSLVPSSISLLALFRKKTVDCSRNAFINQPHFYCSTFQRRSLSHYQLFINCHLSKKLHKSVQVTKMNKDLLKLALVVPNDLIKFGSSTHIHRYVCVLYASKI